MYGRARFTELGWEEFHVEDLDEDDSTRFDGLYKDGVNWIKSGLRQMRRFECYVSILLSLAKQQHGQCIFIVVQSQQMQNAGNLLKDSVSELHILLGVRATNLAADRPSLISILTWAHAVETQIRLDVNRNIKVLRMRN